MTRKILTGDKKDAACAKSVLKKRQERIKFFIE